MTSAFDPNDRGAILAALDDLDPDNPIAAAIVVRIGVLEEVTGQRRSCVFGYRRYLAILSGSTEPLPAGKL